MLAYRYSDMMRVVRCWGEEERVETSEAKKLCNCGNVGLRENNINNFLNVVKKDLLIWWMATVSAKLENTDVTTRRMTKRI